MEGVALATGLSPGRREPGRWEFHRFRRAGHAPGPHGVQKTFQQAFQQSSTPTDFISSCQNDGK